ncbi:uncharacterized protein METZ01_LOCUS83691 [marine metagenome]|uniref:Calcium/calmodulin-dependent protein kinase II association-domain domain-containing protein n=1 Tax=marine metagenome TaxID=408172 RepID=A0A381UU04_9ZZZZ
MIDCLIYNMKTFPIYLSLLCFLLNNPQTGYAAEEEKERLVELDAYWAEVSRAVREGDFEGYKATCHEKGVLVSGTKKTSYPLSEALVRWKKDFTATKAGKIKAKVEFRFSQRFGDETTAHETGIFLYSFTDPEGRWTQEHIHFQALLLKGKDGWKIMMEYQKSKAKKVEWDALTGKEQRRPK